jgi:rhodanese/phosphatase family protein
LPKLIGLRLQDHPSAAPCASDLAMLPPTRAIVGGMSESLPIADCYWVEHGLLLAGEYPGAVDPERAGARLQRFETAGIKLFVDLTQPFEFTPYAHLLDVARHERRPIPDFGTTSTAAYRATLDLIDRSLEARAPVYVHCLGGRGRTGTVVGCWLVRHGCDAPDAVGRISELRGRLPDAWAPSPETPEQREVVEGWRRGA